MLIKSISKSQIEIVGTKIGPEETFSYGSVVLSAMTVFNHSSCREILTLQDRLFVSMTQHIITELFR